VSLVLLLAASCVMGWPGLTHFQADEARLYTRRWRWPGGGELATHGIASSIGFPNSPVSVWFYALPLLVWPHVYGTTLFTGLANLSPCCRLLVDRAPLLGTCGGAGRPAAVGRGSLGGNSCTPHLGAESARAPRHHLGNWRPAGVRRAPARLHRRAPAGAGVGGTGSLCRAGLVPATLVFLAVFWRRLRWRPILAGGAAGASALAFHSLPAPTGRVAGVEGLASGPALG
jgi:hypothetical protein